jgi:hypothetical protein
MEPAAPVKDFPVAADKTSVTIASHNASIDPA